MSYSDVETHYILYIYIYIYIYIYHKITKKLLTNPANTLRQSWRGDSYLHNGAKIDMWQQIILAESPFNQKYRETR